MLQNYAYRVNAVLSSVTTLRWLLMVATLFFLLGLFLPMIIISKFMVINNSISIISGLAELINEGQILIFMIVGIFSVILPIFKIGFLFLLLQSTITTTKQYKKLLYLMHEYGRWTMLDVMVVAMLIVTVKLGVIASIQVHAGLYFFGLAVLLLMFITSKVSKLTTERKRM
ncbi:paraquat-inducible protein A [uncultured Psychromonas sp.]|uniref:paraquat-inducible protein A n=1 Tax=uncultured Psychromonas sp. TaxID=173974 RepID=UPI002628B37E|nr:paraquat-inducible protein A [uncultured Psychromonas sp.]